MRMEDGRLRMERCDEIRASSLLSTIHHPPSTILHPPSSPFPNWPSSILAVATILSAR